MTPRELTIAAALALAPAWAASAGELTINLIAADAVQKPVFEELIAGFEEANPDVSVSANFYDAETYKSSIRNFLSADAPDVAAWYAGNRMAPFVRAGLFEPIDDLWASDGVGENLESAEGAVTMDGKIWGVPYTYYQWGVYYRKDIFEDLGIAPPASWEEFLAAGEKLNEAGIKPLTIGTKFLWTAAGVFDYINLRTNGYEFHNALTAGEIPWTDDRVRATMANWEQLLDAGFFIENHTSYSWQEAIAPMINGEAAMYLMGNFLVGPMREAGLSDDQIGFFQFPEITPGVPMAEDAPTDTFHIPAGADNKEDARRFLAYVVSADAQTKLNAGLGQLPVNSQSSVADDVILRQGFEMLSNASGLAQFFDRDAPAEMAKEGMAGFQEFMVNPDRLDQILERLEKVRARVY